MSNSKERDQQIVQHYMSCFETLRKFVANDLLRFDVGRPFVWISYEVFGLMFFDERNQLDKQKALVFLDKLRAYINFLRRGRNQPLAVVADDADIHFLVYKDGAIAYVGRWVQDNLILLVYGEDDR